jgi:hypothetical protein
MKHYILVSVEIPTPGDDQYSKWLSLEKRLEPLAKTTKGNANRVGEVSSLHLSCRDGGARRAL